MDGDGEQSIDFLTHRVPLNFFDQHIVRIDPELLACHPDRFLFRQGDGQVSF